MNVAPFPRSFEDPEKKRKKKAHKVFECNLSRPCFNMILRAVQCAADSILFFEQADKTGNMSRLPVLILEQTDRTDNMSR